MRILVTGGCGYVGSALVPELLRAGHKVIVVDAQWFGENMALPLHDNLLVFKFDIRDDVGYPWLWETDCVIHLAAVANDPCCELDPKLTWEVNALATERLIDAAARAGVPRFIYASSGSVYGVKPDNIVVTEELNCNPISEYNKTKMVAERVCLSYSDQMIVQILRPATVCGWSPRTRLDVAVNALTISALSMGEIKVFGGEQLRPNLHIEDMVRAYLHMLAHPEFAGVYNVGFENYTINDIALMVSKYCGGRIVTEKSTDIRSYRLNSNKIITTGFKPCGSVAGAIVQLRDAWDAGSLKNTDNGYNLRVMPR